MQQITAGWTEFGCHASITARCNITGTAHDMHVEVSMKKRIINFALFLLLLTVEICIALFVHDRFVRPYIGDVLVVMVLYFLVRVFVPEGCRWLPWIIFIFATGVEFLQYFNLVELLGLSDNRFMRTILGSVFDFKDIVCYGVGCAVLSIGQWVCTRKFSNIWEEQSDK